MPEGPTIFDGCSRLPTEANPLMLYQVSSSTCSRPDGIRPLGPGAEAEKRLILLWGCEA